MANKTIDDLTAAGAITGAERVHLVQGVNSRKATVAQMIAAGLIADVALDRILALTDAGQYIRRDNAAANTITVPTNATVAFPLGTEIHIRQAGAGKVTIAAQGGVTLLPAAAAIRAQHSVLTLKKVAADTWDVFGDLA